MESFYNKGMDKDNNKLCDKCGLLPQSPVQPKPPVCERKKKCCKKDCCENEFVFRKVVIPAALGDDTTGKAKPENGAYTNSYVEYEANGAQYMYDSYGVYTKIEGGGGGEGTLDFNGLENRPKYAGEEMTGETDIPNVATAVAAEATLREAADTALSGDIAAEALARQNADSGLQSQIDAISASSDVTDIVGTYAELQAYDTSTLRNNDIIKVLQDEEHNDETTYYRWSTATQTFTLIGEEGPYYTKSAADAKFQDKLTAGANVSIDQSTNTISATDTTYNNFTGTDGVNAGTAGLVPAPAVSDAGKYLKADGTWDTVSGGIPATATFWGASYDSVNNRVTGNIALTTSVSGTYAITHHGGMYSSPSVRFSDNNVLMSSYRGGNQFASLDLGNSASLSATNSTGETSWIVYAGDASSGYFSASNRQIRYLADPTNGTDAATKNYCDTKAIGISETLTIADTDWTALSASDPYDYSATVTVTTTISATSTVELINDQPVLFGTHGFAIGSVDTTNNTVTIYSIGAPSASVSLTIKVRS